MTNEEIQKMMEFILQQQATTTVNIEQLTEKVDRLSEAQLRTERSIGQMAQVQSHMNEVVAAIADAQQRADDKLAELAAQQARTDQQLSETDERLNVLIGVVERYFSNGRNGGAKN
jgi:ABC-type transporter Mla subunit MlaD